MIFLLFMRINNMPSHDKWAIVFRGDMQHPLYIQSKTFEEFWYQLRDMVQKYGKFEMIYRVN